ncbi:hypothetical protein I553_9059 [Mycobacterium xenopi 4042]|uniref:Uncharacterized protein n=1 Tax=Mycobacterium xenopi 4042 TaxID=1299334 RepID=X8AM68_MYCXE|nr:hypothetical protein I553_9059 [Mycobacterium xenopi 4042]
MLDRLFNYEHSRAISSAVDAARYASVQIYCATFGHRGPNSTTRHVQLGMGVLALSISTLIIARSKARRRERVPTRLVRPDRDT